MSSINIAINIYYYYNILIFVINIITCRGADFPASKIKPTLFFSGFSFCCWIMCAQPGKFPSARRFFGTVNNRTAEGGRVFWSMSFPYRHRPASSLRLSRAPKPAMRASFLSKTSTKFSTEIFKVKILTRVGLGMKFF